MRAESQSPQLQIRPSSVNLYRSARARPTHSCTTSTTDSTSEAAQDATTTTLGQKAVRMYPPNSSFNVPFVRPLEVPLHPGRVISIYGVVPHHSERFSVNLQTGPSPEPHSDVALHISVRLPEQIVVRNTFQGSWQNEERHGGMPIQRGQPFQLLIMCEHSSFKIAFNGVHYAEYFHRMPFERVTHVAVSGDVQINTVGGVAGHPGEPDDKVHNPMVPHVQHMRGGAFPGRLVRIRGRVPHHAYRFETNLQCGPSESDDIALHVSVRPNEGVVELNSQRGGCWEQGVQLAPCPVRNGQAFEILVLVDEYNFKIAFNGVHLSEFPHRMPYHMIGYVAVRGSVNLTMVSNEGQRQSGSLSFVPMPPQGGPIQLFPTPYENHDHLYFPNPYPY